MPDKIENIFYLYIFQLVKIWHHACYKYICLLSVFVLAIGGLYECRIS